MYWSLSPLGQKSSGAVRARGSFWYIISKISLNVNWPRHCWWWARWNILVESTHQTEASSLMVGKQKVIRRGQGPHTAFKSMSQWLTSPKQSCLPLVHSAMNHQWVTLLRKPAPSWSVHFPRASPVGTKTSAREQLGFLYIWTGQHQGQPIRLVLLWPLWL